VREHGGTTPPRARPFKRFRLSHEPRRRPHPRRRASGRKTLLPLYKIGSSIVIVRGALVLVPALLLTFVRTVSSVPTSSGPTALSLASSGALWVEGSASPGSVDWES